MALPLPVLAQHHTEGWLPGVYICPTGNREQRGHLAPPALGILSGMPTQILYHGDHWGSDRDREEIQSYLGGPYSCL